MYVLGLINYGGSLLRIYYRYQQDSMGLLRGKELSGITRLADNDRYKYAVLTMGYSVPTGTHSC